MRKHFDLPTFLVSCLVLAMPLMAKADLVFVNMNGSTTEIPAAQQAAAVLGEKIYVLPTSETSHYETEQLTEDLIRLAKQGVRPRAMIVSGHHVKNQGYFGSNGEVSLHRIGALLPTDDVAVQSFFAGIQSLYLWGCYTGTLTNVDRLIVGYNTAFTQTKYVVGFADKAPLATVPASGQVLKEMLLKESQLRQAPREQLHALIQQTSANYHDKYDFILHRGKTFVTKDGASEVENFIASCSDESSRKSILEAVTLVWKYYWNEIGPLPEETGKGPLREAYRHLQKNNFCLQMGAVELHQVEEIPPLSTVIRLIYYKNVVQNFAKIYAAHLEFAQKELRALEALPDVGYLSQLAQTERGILMKNLDDLHKALKTALPKYKTQPAQRARYFYFNAMINDIESVIYPSEDYVPQSWIDPGAQEGSRFKVLNDFAKAKERSRKKAYRQLGVELPPAPAQTSAL